ncbi:MAG: hypothetical protein QS721_05015 [Candidatus Endonucleobacter sp. (ex Gigantidas childressi)]|nr:hypothetical protein [Candidatus Endonucleobacter sp. (ex Gigantidas childressi)]
MRLGSKWFFLARDYGAKLKNEKERQQVLDYLSSLPPESLFEDIGVFEGLFKNKMPVEEYFNKASLLDDISSTGTAALIDVIMIDAMDDALLEALKSNELTDNKMDAFYSKGKWFEPFLAFNGFTKTLAWRLNSMDDKKALAAVTKIDLQGNDLLIAAIKSLDEKAVDAILKVSNARVNEMIADAPHHYSKGKRPLHIAIQWDVPVSIFKLLILNGANPSLPNSSGTSALRLLWYYENEWKHQPEKFNQVRYLLSYVSGVSLTRDLKKPGLYPNNFNILLGGK